MLTQDFEDMIKRFADNGSVGGVFLAKPTGKVLDEDKTFIEVEVYNKSMYAKPCMSFGSFSVPNEDWLKEYKDEIMVWVAFENGNPAHPVYMGVCPADEKNPSGNYPNIKTWKSIEFNYIFDDKDKKFKIEHKDGSFLSIDGNSGEIECKSKDGQGWKANTQTILGGGNGTKSAVLGETIVQLLDTALTALIGATIPTPTGGVGTLDPAVITQLTNVKAQLNTSLSQKVKLD